jgi:membrane complex biogenesis BtpA family protein
MRLIGVIHLPPLPGSYKYSGNFEEIIDFAINEAKKIEEGGFDALILENFYDNPFRKRVRRETSIAMGIIAREVKKSVSIKVGINLLRNSTYDSVVIAGLTGDFVRVNALCETISSPEGIIEPTAVEAFEAMFYLKKKITILADIFVKHASPLHQRNIKDVVLDCIERNGADYLIVTGSRTGEEVDLKLLKEVKNYSPVPVCIGSGITSENISKYMADCFIIGTYLKDNNGRINLEKVKRIANAYKNLYNR